MYKFQSLNSKTNNELLQVFKGERTGWIKVGKKGYIFPRRFAEHIEFFNNFTFKSTDTVVATFPRSGTTWTQELVWLVANDLDFDTAKTQHLIKRFPFFEYYTLVNPDLIKELLESSKGNVERETILKQMLEKNSPVINLPDPRFIKTHLPFSLLSNILDSDCNIVYVARNPKDVAVSWYHHHKAFASLDFIGNFEEFWKYFKNDLIIYSPYWAHLKEAWELRHHPNVLFLFYEEMYKDLTSVVKKVAAFFNKKYNDDEIAKLVEHLDIKNFKKNPAINVSHLVGSGLLRVTDKFIRRGISGGWKDTFTKELEAEADEWIAENLKDTDLKFPSFEKNVQ